jgi:hypothetical protein
MREFYHMQIPTSLKTWFTIHFFADMLFGIPLLVAPIWTLTLFGFDGIETTTARLVGAALIGIGGTSLIVKEASVESYRTMLTLKLIWSSSAVLGLVLSLFSGENPMIWLFIAVFVVFFLVWQHYYRLLGR